MRPTRLLFAAVLVIASCVTLSPAGDQAAYKVDEGDITVIGYVQFRDRYVTIGQGPEGTVYTITRNGETVAANITESDLKKEFPAIYNRIKTGLAGNDATLRINFAKDLLRGMR
ncbi:MAG: hypothetical protein GXX84_18550 [Acidobacteria bacterium]|nr:hypothetical protein [Acidobacteriota bacterium]